MSQIKYLQQTYGGTPFMFFEDKAAALWATAARPPLLASALLSLSANKGVKQ